MTIQDELRSELVILSNESFQLATTGFITTNGLKAYIKHLDNMKLTITSVLLTNEA